MAELVDRREFLRTLGVGAGVTLGAAASAIPLIGMAQAQTPMVPKGNIPSTPYKIGHMTFFTGPAAVLGEPMYKGQVLAAEEINASGGLLGKRKIEVLKADEAAGVDGNVKELRRLKLQEKIDFFCGITSSGNSPALGPVAEELKVLTIFVDGCTDFLFDKAVPNPNYSSASPTSSRPTAINLRARGRADLAGREEIAHIHPDYSYGRNAFDHFNVIMKSCSRSRKSSPEAGRSSAPPTSAPTSPRPSRRSPTCWSPRSGAEITWRSTSRRCDTGLSTR